MSDKEHEESIAAWKAQMKDGGHICVDLDATLAHHGKWLGPTHIGEPIKPMLDRVLKWLGDGVDVRLFTARATPMADGKPEPGIVEAIDAWCMKHVGRLLPITNQKTWETVEMWDDRAVQVVPNTGLRADGKD